MSDPWNSRDWYVNVLDCSPLLDFEVERGVEGVVVRHPCGLLIGLHKDPRRAAALRGFALLGFSVPDRRALEEWTNRLDRRHVRHFAVTKGHLGWYLDVPDVDGVLVRFHTEGGPNAEEA